MPGLDVVGILDERDGGVDGNEFLEHFLGGFVVEGTAGAGQADADAGDEAIDHAGDHFAVGFADVAVADDVGEGREGGHEMADIAGDGGDGLEAFDEERGGGGEIREEGGIEEVSERLKFGGGFGFVADSARGGGGGGVAPDRGFDDVDGEFGFPLEVPDFVKGSFGVAAEFLAIAPFDGEEAEAMEKMAAVEVVRFAEV